MILIGNGVGTKQLFSYYPLLKPSRAENFDNINFAGICKKLAINFVKKEKRN
jgi:hypothetical protein